VSAIQSAALGAFSWARPRFKLRNDMRPATLIMGSYLIVVILVAMHFARRWGLISSEVYRDDGAGIAISVCVITAVSFFGFRRKI